MKPKKTGARSRTKGARMLRTRTPARPRTFASPWRVFTFPQVKGKIIQSVEFSTDEWDNNITLNFNDGTALSFDIHPEPQFSIMADYADWRQGNWRPIKRWQRLSRWR